jgi:hypothetical protein
MTDGFVIDPRYCGPPEVGNGGYVAGMVATYLDGPAKVTLRTPPPLGTPLAVRRLETGVRVCDDETVVADAVPAGGELELPEPVTLADARAAGQRSRLRTHPRDHPYPRCFVCGSDRAPGDGFHLMVGPVDGRTVAADVWRPADAVPVDGGHVPTEFVWAALDCPGGLGAFGESPSGMPYVLGRFEVRQLSPVPVAEAHVVIGWRQGEAGRKLLAGSALYSADGEPRAVATATWIRLR